MAFLNSTSGVTGALGDAASGGATALDRLVSGNSNQTRSFERDGFVVPPIPSPSGEGLPSSKIKSQRDHRNKRHIIHWFVPEVGVINMYINPQSISYNAKKMITSERTKAGFINTYWGEELMTLGIRGHTGSSGIEGLNVLYEIYRAEQINFDPIGLTMASDSMVSGLGNLIGGAGQGVGGLGGELISSTAGILGLNPLTQTILPRNPPSLASLAFSVEMYYNHRVQRGYFTSFSYTESVDQMGLFNYDIGFTVTQTRGYRINTYPHQRSANDGPSNNSEGGVPLSYGTGTSFGR